MIDRAAALAALEQALRLAQPEGYVRTFVDAGAAFQELLAALSPDADLAPYRDQVLAAFGTGTVPVTPTIPPKRASAAARVAPGAGDERLTARELEVLRLIGAGKSNGEIAAAMVVAVSTVKAHINNIFGKLGVTSRTQALVRARELDLL